jgi:hypothetical protein
MAIVIMRQTFHSFFIGTLFGLFPYMKKVNPTQHILLADDDKDHAMLFERTIKKEYPSISISYVNNGEELI